MDRARYQKYVREQRILNAGKPCETCGKQHGHNYGTGRFCCKKCAQQCKRTGKASDKLRAHLDKLRSEGKISVKAPYGTWTCQRCKSVFDTAKQLHQHQLVAYGRVLAKSETLDGMFKCKHCGREFAKPQSLGAHMMSCKMHPNSKQHQKMHKDIGLKLKAFYKEHPEKAVQFGKHISSEVKQKISEARVKQLQNEFLDKPYAHIKWLKVKNLRGEEFSVRGHWEENVCKRLNELGIYWTKAKPIKYFDEYWHNYVPDLHVPVSDTYVEVKGRYPESDQKKMKLVLEQHPNLRIYFIHDCYHDFIQGNCNFDDNLLMKL